MRKYTILVNIIITFIILYIYIAHNIILAEQKMMMDPVLLTDLKKAICKGLINVSKEHHFMEFCGYDINYPLGSMSFYKQYFSNGSYIETFVNKLPLDEIFQNYETRNLEDILEHISNLFYDDVIKTRTKFNSRLYYIPHIFFSFDLPQIISRLELTSHIAERYIEIHPMATENIPIITQSVSIEYNKLKPLTTGIVYVAISMSGDSSEILLQVEIIYKYFDFLLPIKMKITPIEFALIPVISTCRETIPNNVLQIQLKVRPTLLVSESSTKSKCFKESNKVVNKQ